MKNKIIIPIVAVMLLFSCKKENGLYKEAGKGSFSRSASFVMYNIHKEGKLTMSFENDNVKNISIHLVVDTEGKLGEEIINENNIKVVNGKTTIVIDRKKLGWDENEVLSDSIGKQEIKVKVIFDDNTITEYTKELSVTNFLTYEIPDIYDTVTKKNGIKYNIPKEKFDDITIKKESVVGKKGSTVDVSDKDSIIIVGNEYLGDDYIKWPINISSSKSGLSYTDTITVKILKSSIDKEYTNKTLRNKDNEWFSLIGGDIVIDTDTTKGQDLQLDSLNAIDQGFTRGSGSNSDVEFYKIPYTHKSYGDLYKKSYISDMFGIVNSETLTTDSGGKLNGGELFVFKKTKMEKGVSIVYIGIIKITEINYTSEDIGGSLGFKFDYKITQLPKGASFM